MCDSGAMTGATHCPSPMVALARGIRDMKQCAYASRCRRPVRIDCYQQQFRASSNSPSRAAGTEPLTHRHTRRIRIAHRTTSLFHLLRPQGERKHQQDCGGADIYRQHSRSEFRPNRLRDCQYRVPDAPCKNMEQDYEAASCALFRAAAPARMNLAITNCCAVSSIASSCRPGAAFHRALQPRPSSRGAG